MKRTGFDWVKEVITDAMVNEAVTEEIDTVRRAAAHQVHPPMYLTLYTVTSRDGGEKGITYAQTEFGNDFSLTDRHMAFERIGETFPNNINALPVMVVHVSEAWYLVAERKPGGEPPTREEWEVMASKHGRVSEHPDRRECVIITCETLDGRAASALLPFESGDDGSMNWIMDDEQFIHVDDDKRSQTLESNFLNHFYTGLMRSKFLKNME